MKLISKIFLTICLSFFGFSKTTQAQEESGLVSATGLNIIIPQGALADTYDHGFGVYANFDYNFNKFLAARFDLGWNDVSGPETSYIDPNGTIHTNHPNMSVWEFTAGLRAKVSVFYIEARGGYFSGVNEWGFVPAVGLRMGKFDIQGNYTFAGDNEWAAVRFSYYWGND